MEQILIKVPAINKVAYNCLGVVSKRTMRFADSFCLVRKISRSFFEREKRAASLPAIAKDKSINATKSPTKKTVPCGQAASNRLLR